MEEYTIGNSYDTRLQVVAIGGIVHFNYIFYIH